LHIRASLLLSKIIKRSRDLPRHKNAACREEKSIRLLKHQGVTCSPEVGNSPAKVGRGEARENVFPGEEEGAGKKQQKHNGKKKRHHRGVDLGGES